MNGEFAVSDLAGGVAIRLLGAIARDVRRKSMKLVLPQFFEPMTSMLLNNKLARLIFELLE